MRTLPILALSLTALAIACKGGDSITTPLVQNGSISVNVGGGGNGTLTFQGNGTNSTSTSAAVAGRTTTGQWAVVGASGTQSALNDFVLVLNGTGTGSYALSATCGSDGSSGNCLVGGMLMTGISRSATAGSGTAYEFTTASVTVTTYESTRVAGSFTAQATGLDLATGQSSGTVTITGTFDVPVASTVTVPSVP